MYGCTLRNFGCTHLELYPQNAHFILRCHTNVALLARCVTIKSPWHECCATLNILRTATEGLKAKWGELTGIEAFEETDLTLSECPVILP